MDGFLHYVFFAWMFMKASVEASTAIMEASIASMKASVEASTAFMEASIASMKASVEANLLPRKLP